MSWEQSGDKLEKSNYVAFDLVRGKTYFKMQKFGSNIKQAIF